MYQSILLPVDISEHELTVNALKEAAYLMEKSQASLRLLYVISTMPDYFLSHFSALTLQYEDTVTEDIKQQLDIYAKSLTLPADRLTSNVRQGAIYDEILKEADEINAELIIIGSRRPSMSTYLLGSNAAAIVRHAKTSVLVVR
ncbi:universal stress protein [Sodalis sp. RH22]|uniref:universal stress protein n=1 Tax=unclassified Sodalis (in: enterobacteria) TaxID=2636512 RepID=UPI0039B6C88D